MRSPPGELFILSISYVQCEEHEEGGVNTAVMGFVIVLLVKTLVVEAIVGALWVVMW